MESNTHNFNHLVSIANNALQIKDYPSAEKTLKQALLLQPKNCTAAYLYGVSLKYLNKPKKALKYISLAINSGMDDAAAFYQYAELLLSLKQPEKAKQQLKHALEIKDDFIQATFMLANIYYEQNKLEQAKKYYLMTLDQSKDHCQALYNLSHVYYRQLDYPKALFYLNKCVDICGPDSIVYAKIATIHEQLNHLEQARLFAEKSLSLDVNNIDAMVTQIKYFRRENQLTKGLKILEGIDISGKPAETQIIYWAEKGKLCEQNHLYPEAYHAFKQAKKHLRIVQQRNPIHDLSKVMNHSRSMMKNKLFRSLEDRTETGKPSRQIIFVVGFFRSGTTLLEKILTEYQGVKTVGELEALSRIEKKAAKMSLTLKNADEIEKWRIENRQFYFDEAINRGLDQKDLSLFIDKTPFNIARLPLIRVLFPDALIIRVIRHPLDVAISCFTEVFSERYDWSYSLKETIKLIHKVERHYTEVIEEKMGLDCLQVKYEDLVKNPQENITKILNKINRTWDSKCLEFYQNASETYTASYDQVSKPLYTSSIDRYKKYYNFFDRDSLKLIKPILLNHDYQEY